VSNPRLVAAADSRASTESLNGGGRFVECVFCDLIGGLAPLSEVHRDRQVIAFMDIQPVNPGHVLVAPIQHSLALADLDPEVGAELFRVAQRVAHVIRSSQHRAEGVNLFLADGEVAGQEVPHVHLHVFPRYGGDGVGLRFGPDYSNRPHRSQLDATAHELKSLLESFA
jgi:histidine triad (HIT) family protein